MSQCLSYKFSKKELYQYYIIEKLTLEEIAKIYNCGRQTIANYLKKYDIQTRSISEALCGKFIGKKSPSYINGELL